jgi:hypothetical protein
MTLMQLIRSTIRMIFQKPYVYETRTCLYEMEDLENGKQRSKKRRAK